MLLTVILISLTCARAPRLNVLLVSFDTTRADHLGCYGRAGGVTPVLDSLAASGVLFERASTPVPITLPAHASLLTGAYPPAHGVRNNGTFSLGADIPTLAETFSSAGYSTAAFVSAFVLDNRYGLARGFGVYDDDMHHGGRTAGVLGQRERRAEVTVSRTIDWLSANRRKPFFTLVHFFDPHRPFEAPEPFAGRFKDPYDAEIAYSDHCLGLLLEALDSLKLSGNTVVAVVGDHGEGLGDHGEQTHSTFLYESTLHVPLLIRIPGNRDHDGARVSTPVSLVDVAPTLAALCGLEPPGMNQGQALITPRGLTTPRPERPLYLECLYAWFCHGWSPLEGVIRGNRKYIRAPRPELYDLAADPGELINLAGESPALADSLARVLEVLRGEITPRGGKAYAVRSAGSEETAHLRALGYVSGRSAAPERDISGLPDPKDMIGTVGQYMLGVSYMSDGRLDLAAREFQSLLEVDGSNYSAWEFLAETQLLRGFADSALSAADKAAQALAPSERSFFLAGNALLELGDSADASSRLDRALELNPEYGPALALKAGLLAAQGDPRGALALYCRADSVMPLNPDLLTDLGELLLRLNLPDSAITVLARASAVSGAGWKVWFDLGVALQIAGKHVDAEAAYTRAAGMSEAGAGVFNNLGIVRYSLKKYRESCQAYREALELDPAYAEAWNNLGGSLAALGRSRDAAGAYVRALELKPLYPDAGINFGMLLADRLEQPDSACRVIARALDPMPDSPRRRSAAAFLRRLENRPH